MRPVLLLVPLLLVSACSGGSSPEGSSSQGSSSGSPSSGRPDKSTYLAQAEELCAQGVAQQKKLVAPTAIGDFAPYVQQLVQVAATTTRGLTALTPPDADAAQLRAKVLDPLQAQLRLAQTFADEVQAATKGNDQAALGRLALNPPTKAKADLAFMRSYGFSTCVDAADTSN